MSIRYHILRSGIYGDGHLTLFDDPNSPEEEVVEAYQESHYYSFGSACASLRTAVDPLAEKYYSWSPYNYTANNPIRFVDPDGSRFGDHLWEFNKATKYTRITQRFKYNTNSRGAKLPSGTDCIKESVTTTVQVAGVFVEETIITEVQIDENGEIDKDNINVLRLKHVENRTGTGGPDYHNETKSKTVSFSEVNPELQKNAKSEAEFKAEDGKSSLQESAESINHAIAVGASVTITLATAGAAGVVESTTVLTAQAVRTAGAALGIGTGAAIEYSEGVVSPEDLKTIHLDREERLQ